jgi:hypothetical protein
MGLKAHRSLNNVLPQKCRAKHAEQDGRRGIFEAGNVEIGRAICTDFAAIFALDAWF